MPRRMPRRQIRKRSDDITDITIGNPIHFIKYIKDIFSYLTLSKRVIKFHDGI